MVWPGLLVMLIGLCGGPALCRASFTLFLPASEVRKLIGLNRELMYVTDGYVHRHATEMPLQLSEEVDRLHFKWWAEKERQVSYSLRISTSDQFSLHQPHLNISHRGFIPSRPSVWRVSLPCSQRSNSTRVDINIDLRVEGLEPDGGSEALRIVRRKTCTAKAAAGVMRGVNGAGAGQPAADGKDGGAGLSQTRSPNKKYPAAHLVFLGLVLGATAVVLLIVLAIKMVHLRNWKPPLSPTGSDIFVAGAGAGQIAGYGEMEGKTGMANIQTMSQQQPTVAGEMQLIRQVPQQQMYQMSYHPLMQQENPSLPSHQQMLSSHLDRPHSQQSNSQPLYHAMGSAPQYEPGMSEAESRVTEWVQSQKHMAEAGAGAGDVEAARQNDPETIMELLEVDRLRLKLGQLLQEGTFGRIYQGTLQNVNVQHEEDVYVKTVVSGSSPAQSRLLIEEATRLQGLMHNHLQTLVATTWDGTSPMLVYPYLSCGNLKRHLQANHAQAGLSTHAVVSLGLQMCKALQHLHKRKMLHKDVAARNCFLGEGNLLKLADSALSRDFFPADYHCLGDNENRPIKWMPIEAIGQKNYSRASDVWSFGVFMWELMTRAQQPFSDIDPFEMESYLLDSYRLHQPLNCPDQLYQVLSSCWGRTPHERASVHSLYNSLQTLQKQLQQFV